MKVSQQLHTSRREIEASNAVSRRDLSQSPHCSGGLDCRSCSYDDEVQGRRGLPRHELLYQFRILVLPVVGQQVRSAQNQLRAIVEVDGQVCKFPDAFLAYQQENKDEAKE